MASPNAGSGTTLMAIAIALIAFAGGYVVGNMTGPDGDTKSAAVSAEGAAVAQTGTINDSDRIPIADSPIFGNPDAPITIVKFSEFQCPFCQRGSDTMKELIKKYPNDVRMVFKHFPLDFHKQAPAASKAAMAAREQGKFWEMHDILFQNMAAFRDKSDDEMLELTAGYARQLNLDIDKFKADFQKPEYQATIDRDMQLGSTLGVRGTPHFFVNGERVSGAQPLPAFEEIVKKQLEKARGHLSAGVAKQDLYKTMVAENYDAPAQQPQQQPKQAPQPQAQRVEMATVRPNDPMKGETENYLVTIVEFSNFQCPFCARVMPQLAQLKENYGDKVRFVFKQNPLAFHQEAPIAHQAALAAHEQGKFWEMHKILFDNMGQFRGADMKELTRGFAQQLGLNMQRFNQAMESGKYASWIEEDQKLASSIGAQGTPNFFINGVNVVGAKPYAEFEQVVKQQIEIAEKIKRERNLSGDALYAAVVEHNKANAPAAPAAAAQAQPQQPPDRVDEGELVIGNSPTKGPANAPITIFEFSSFQCPYCARGNESIQQVLREYGDQVRVVFKAFPLPFQQQSEPAHRAALAAGKQGKFWEMHEKIYANQQAIRDVEVLERWAQELGLNMERYRADFESDELKKQVQDEIEQGRKVGVRGTPAFFINGQRLVGAQPYERFKAVIDAELAKK